MKFTPDAAVPDGQFDGLNAAGVVIVRTVFTPCFQRVIGTHEDESLVVEWRTSPAGIRRIAATMGWVASGAQTWGNA